MKAVILLCALSILSVATQRKSDFPSIYSVKTEEDLNLFGEECIKAGNISTEIAEELKAKKYQDNEETRCYFKCLFEKIGIFKNYIGFDVLTIHSQVAGRVPMNHYDPTHKKIVKCVDNNTENTDDCTWAYRGAMCFIKENVKLVKENVPILSDNVPVVKASVPVIKANVPVVKENVPILHKNLAIVEEYMQSNENGDDILKNKTKCNRPFT